MDEAAKKKALDVIQTIFRDQFLDDRLTITEATTPDDIEEWDSVAQVGLLAAVESAFDVRFTADDMVTIDSVRALLATLAERGTS